jgi:thiazolinyl imide reductase
LYISSRFLKASSSAEIPDFAVSQKRKLLLCGTNYGSAYLPAIRELATSVQLIGILARGSQHSQALARALAVPLHSRIDDIQGPLDSAIVAIGGEAGDKLSLELLRRNVSVLREHPVAPAFLKRAYSLSSSAILHVNYHISDLPAAKIFRKACRQASTSARPLSISATFNGRTLASGLELLLRTLTELRFAAYRLRLELFDSAWATIGMGNLKGTAISVHVDWRTTRTDDGRDLVAGHDVSIRWQDVSISLSSMVGPVIKARDWAGSRNRPAWQVLDGSRAPTRTKIVSTIRPRANLFALRRLLTHQITGRAPAEQKPEHLVQVATIWRQFLQRSH